MKIINHKLLHVISISKKPSIYYEDIHHLLCTHLEENEEHYKLKTVQYYNDELSQREFKTQTINYYATRRTLINLIENLDNIKIR